jgi:hypothetical protein
MEKDSIDYYINELKQAIEDPMHTNDDKLFCELFNCGISFLGLDDEILRREFGINKPTLERWKNGHNAPHTAMRPHIYKYLMDMAVCKWGELSLNNEHC